MSKVATALKAASAPEGGKGLQSGARTERSREGASVDLTLDLALASMRYAGERTPEATASYFGPRPAVPLPPRKIREDEDIQRVRRTMESYYRMSFDGIALRTDPQAASRAASLGARAYTDGREIGFAEGRFAPDTREGMHTIAHEFAHVAQMRGGTGGRMPSAATLGSTRLQPETLPEADRTDAAERDADNAAAAMIDGRSSTVGAVDGVLTLAEGPTGAPPKGEVRINLDKTRAVQMLFNAEDVIEWADILSMTYHTYVLKAFAGGTSEMADAYLDETKDKLTLYGDALGAAKSEAGKKHGVIMTITPPLHEAVAKFLKDKYGVDPLVKVPEGSSSLPPKNAGKDPTKGEPTGSPEGIRRFDPSGKLTWNPVYPRYATGAKVVFRVQFDKSDPGNAALNFLYGRVRFDWTVMKGADVVDTGPWLESADAYIEYDYTFSETGTYTVHVNVSSRYFKDDKQLDLVSGPLTVVEQSEVEKGLFEEHHVGKGADKPFERDAATGELARKKDFTLLGINEEIILLNAYIGALRAMKGISSEDRDAFIAHYEEQIKTLDATRASVSGKTQYVARATFRSEDDAVRIPLSLYMYRVSGTAGPDEASYHVVLHDATSGGEPLEHNGEGDVDATSDPTKDLANAELMAVHDMLSHVHWYNDYPSGKIQFAIELLETKRIIEDVVFTDNPKKTIKTGVGYAAAVGGVLLLAATPFTGGGSTPFGLVLLEAATISAGVAAVSLSLWDRYQTETLHWDKQTLIDVLQLVTLIMAGAGSFTKALLGMSHVGKIGYVGTMMGLDVASFIYIAAETKEQIIGVEADYAIRIGKEPERKVELESARDAIVAQILGAAAVNGLFLLVSTASAIREVKGMMSGSSFVVSERVQSLVETGDAPAIKAELESGTKLSKSEREYLAEALQTKSKTTPEGEPKPEPGELPKPPEKEAPPKSQEEGAPPKPTEKEAPPKPQEEGAPPKPTEEGTQSPKAEPVVAEEIVVVPEKEMPREQEDVTPEMAATRAKDLAKGDPGAATGLSRLEEMFSKKHVGQILEAASESDTLSDLLRALKDDGFMAKEGVYFYVRLAMRPDAIAFAEKYGAQVLAKLVRRYGSGPQLGPAMAKTGSLLDAAADAAARETIVKNLIKAKHDKLDKTLGLAAPKLPRPPKPSKKNLGIDRGSETWQEIKAQLTARAAKEDYGLTPDQIDVWADLKQALEVAKRGGFSSLSREDRLALVEAYEKLGQDAGLPTPWVSSLRGSLAESLFIPTPWAAKRAFMGGTEVALGTKGAKIPDYPIDMGGGRMEWVNLKSAFIHKGPKDTNGVYINAKESARAYKRAAHEEARNLPPEDKYTLDFVFDPGEPTTKYMLRILFEPPSPIYRVIIGRKPYTGPI